MGSRKNRCSITVDEQSQIGERAEEACLPAIQHAVLRVVQGFRSIPERPRSVFAKDYVVTTIDTERMTKGYQVAARYLPHGAQGVPWYVVLDARGDSIASSVGPKGNVGYPYEPPEVMHFMAILGETRQSISEAELDSISADLEAFRTKREQERSDRRGH